MFWKERTKCWTYYYEKYRERLIAAATKKSDFKMLDEIKWVNVTTKSFRKLDKDFQNYIMVLQNLAVKYSPISSKYLLDMQIFLNITS